MAAELEEDYALSAAELPPTRNTFPASSLDSVVFQYDVFSDPLANKAFNVEHITEKDFITVEKCGKEDFKYIAVAPRFLNKFTLFGELSKFVTVSETRFSHIVEDEDRVDVTFTGVPQEKVYLTFYDDTVWYSIECVVRESGYGNITFIANGGGIWCQH